MPIPVNPSAPIHEVASPQPTAPVPNQNPPAPTTEAVPPVTMSMWVDPVSMPITVKRGLTATFHFVVRRGKEAFEWLLETRWSNLSGNGDEPLYHCQLVQAPNKLVEKAVFMASNGGWFAPDGMSTSISDMLLTTFFNEGSGAVLKFMAKDLFKAPDTP